MTVRHAELLVLGTSPLAMLRALQLARQGRKVTLVDRAAMPGGAWVTPGMPGFDKVENGVHLLENRPEFYAALEAMLGIEMEPDLGRSFGIWRGHRIGCAWSRVLLHGLGAANALRGGAIDRARRAWQSSHRAATNLRVPFAYPAAGCAAIVGALVEQLQTTGATFMFGIEVANLQVNSGSHVACSTSDGPIVADRVLLTSRAHAPVQIDGVPWHIKTEDSVCASTNLHVGVKDHQAFDYIEVFGDRVIKRVRDVGRFADPQPPAGEILLCVQTRTPPARRSAVGAEISGHLRRLDLLPPRFEVRAATTHLVQQRTIPDAQLRQLGLQAGGRIIVLPTTDLAEGYVSMMRNQGPVNAA